MSLYDNFSNPALVFQELIGSGTFGNVYKVYDANLCKHVAIKRTIKNGCIVSREYKILQEVKNCEFCIKLLDIFYTINHNHELIQHLVFEFFPISLGRLLRNYFSIKKRMTHEEIKCISKQLLLGLDSIHKLSIIHRDIKPDNILLTLEFPYKLRICDFGSAKKIADPSTPFIVSRCYRAPELIFCNKQYGASIDIWSAGCLIFELYTGFPIFRGRSDGDQFIQIARILGPPNKDDLKALAGSVLNSESLGKALSVGAKQEIVELFTASPCPEIVEEFILGMLAWNPLKRLTAQQCLEHQFFEL